MKSLIIASTALAFTTTAHAGWFGPSDQEIINLQHQLAEQNHATGFWVVVAGVLALVAILTFIVGTILGSRTRRNAQRTHTNGQ